MRLHFLAVSLLASACSIADPSTVPLQCDENNPCPTGRVCEDTGMCSQPADLSMAPPADMSTPDGASGDMSEANGCKTNGTRLAAGEWRCPGAFNSTNKASSLCAAGFTLCAKLSPAALAACNALTGFAASSLIGSRKDTDAVGTARCDQAEIVRVVFGCGSGGGSVNASMTCGAMTRIVDCSAQGAIWNCGNTLDTTSQASSANGVLCCAP